MRIVLFNGPRSSGKTTITRALCEYMGGHNIKCHIEDIMGPIKVNALAEHGLSHEDVKEFEAVKDEPRHELDGKTPREVYIAYGERVRRRHGPTVFADMWKKRVTDTGMNYDYILVPDCRLQAELDAAVSIVGVNKVMLVRVLRPGMTWQNDIGVYMDHDWSFTFDNNGHLENLGFDTFIQIQQNWE